MSLKEDYRDAMCDGARKYKVTKNPDGTVGIIDMTTYTQEGDQFGANDVNEINRVVNTITDTELPEIKKSVSDGKALVAAAITAKRVTTAATATFAQMAANIAKIILGSGNASRDDVLTGKTFTNDDGVEYTGTMADKSGKGQSATVSMDTANSRVQMTIPVNGKYSTTSKLYATYAAIRNLIGLTASKIATGNTVLGLSGTYKGLGDASADNVLNGKRFSTASLSNAAGTMPDLGAINALLSPGGSYTVPKGFHSGTGRVRAKAVRVVSLSSMSVRGFGSSSSEFEPGPNEESFTMPEAGTVYYGGMSACYNSTGNAICEIYRNGIVVDGRNIDSSNRYNWRGTMHKKKFSVSKGDVIVVKTAATSGSHTVATLDAVIVYYDK